MEGPSGHPQQYDVAGQDAAGYPPPRSDRRSSGMRPGIAAAADVRELPVEQLPGSQTHQSPAVRAIGSLGTGEVRNAQEIPHGRTPGN